MDALTGRSQVLAAAVLVAVGSIALLAWLAPRQSDDAGGRFRSALARVAADGSLASGPVELKALTDFAWDRIWVSPPYDKRGVESLIGPDADDVPASGEFESVLVFASEGRLAGWLRVDSELSDLLDADAVACLYVDEPLRPDARIQIQRRTLTFVDASGRPRTDNPGSCPLVDAPPRYEEQRPN